MYVAYKTNNITVKWSLPAEFKYRIIFLYMRKFKPLIKSCIIFQLFTSYLLDLIVMQEVYT